MSRRRTRRESAALLALADAAAEVASLTNGMDARISNHLANALADLWRANDEWQRAQLVACGEVEE